MPGIATSSTRQLVWATVWEARNSSADEKACASKPNSFSKSGSDSRTDSSSSTTDMRGRATIRLGLATLPDPSGTVSENALIKAECPSYFGIGCGHGARYQGIDRYLRLIDSRSH